VRQTLKDVAELAEYESSFRDYLEGLESARAVLEELSFSLRDFADRLEFSPRVWLKSRTGWQSFRDSNASMAERLRLRSNTSRVRKIVCDRSKRPTSASER
jgi:hypothetical protein